MLSCLMETFLFAENPLCNFVEYISLWTQASVAECDRIFTGEGYRKSHGAQEAPGGEAEDRGEAPSRDGNRVDDQILRQRGECVTPE